MPQMRSFEELRQPSAITQQDVCLSANILELHNNRLGVSEVVSTPIRDHDTDDPYPH